MKAEGLKGVHRAKSLRTARPKAETDRPVTWGIASSSPSGRTNSGSRTSRPWQGIDDLEIAIAEHIFCLYHRRVRGEIGYVPPPNAKNNAPVKPESQSADDLVDAR